MTILDFFRMTRHNLRLLLALVGAGLVLAAVWSLVQPVVYQATSTGVVVAGSAGTVNDASSGQMLASSRAQTYIPLVQTQSVAKRTVEVLGEAKIPVAGHLSASVVPGTPLLKISATGSNPKDAQALADAALKATAAEIQNLETLNDPQVQAQNAAKQKAAEEAAKNATPGQPPSQVDLTPTGSVIKLVPYESAIAPGAPVSPNWRMNLALGAIAGLVAGYIVSFIRKGVDQRVRSIGEIESLTTSGVIGVIPETPELAEQRSGGDLREQGLAAEAMRQLRTNLRFIAVDKKPKSFVVTSANPGEGKSTVSANLARVLAEAGAPTILIDADLRRPMQSRTFRVDSAIGLTQVLAGDVDLQDAMQTTDNPNLQVLPAGRIPPNPSELVGSHRMAELIRNLAVDHTVIIDAPPLLPVTDAGLLTAASDGAILVLRVNKTYKEQIRLCSKILEQVNGTLFGAVLNRAPRKGMGAVLYGYGYGYGGYESNSYYYAADGTKKKRSASKGRRSSGRSSTGGTSVPARARVDIAPAAPVAGATPGATSVSPVVTDRES